ncbi:uncharacterized protein AAEQ78_019025 [Lycaon pictus]
MAEVTPPTPNPPSSRGHPPPPESQVQVASLSRSSPTVPWRGVRAPARSQPAGHSQRVRPDDPPGALGLRGATTPAPPGPEQPGQTSQGGAMPLSAPAPRGPPKVGTATSCRPRAPPSPPVGTVPAGTRGLQPAVWGQVAPAPTQPPSPSRAFWAPHPQGPTTWGHLPGRQRASGLRWGQACVDQGIPPPSHPARPLAAPPCWCQPVPHLPPPGPPPGERPPTGAPAASAPIPVGPDRVPPSRPGSRPRRRPASGRHPHLAPAPGGRPAAAFPGLGPLG